MLVFADCSHSINDYQDGLHTSYLQRLRMPHNETMCGATRSSTTLTTM